MTTERLTPALDHLAAGIPRSVPGSREQHLRHGDLGQFEGDIAAVTDNPSADLDEFESCCRKAHEAEEGPRWLRTTGTTTAST